MRDDDVVRVTTSSSMVQSDNDDGGNVVEFRGQDQSLPPNDKSAAKRAALARMAVGDRPPQLNLLSDELSRAMCGGASASSPGNITRNVERKFVAHHLKVRRYAVSVRSPEGGVR